VDVTTAYIELGLRLGRHIDGLVDAYYGPPELAERVQAEDVVAPPELAAAAARLLDSVEPGSWLHAQLVGLETVARRLAGEQIAYEDEVERCYGVRPQWTSEADFEAAHAELDAALPGPGSLAERYQAWREGNVVPGELLLSVVHDLLEALRVRTRAAFGLPEGEAIELDEVADEPWAAFNYYRGGLRSRIVLNTDTAMSPDFVAELAAHEGYPGHHTEHAWKEQVLVRERGDLAESIFLVGTPQSLISEGVAGLGPEILLGSEEEDLIAEHMSPAGVEYDPEVSRAVKHARRPLGRVGGNVALLIHARGASEDEGREYLIRWALASERRAAQSVRFITDPTWRAYVTSYADGYRLCRDFVDGDHDRFKRLLTEQLPPADLV
jgi:hypothetical protein